MKKRASKVANFFAFNLLFFALYLNFIHKDNNSAPVQAGPATQTVNGTVLVNNPEEYLQRHETTKIAAQNNSGQNNQSAALKLSFN